MEVKDYILIFTNIVGWGLAILFFILKRKSERTDKAIENRFKVYSSFLKVADELFEEMRDDPSVFMQIYNDFVKEALQYSGNEVKVNESLIKFNEILLKTTKKSIKPLSVLNSELNNLSLVASDKLLGKIQEFKLIAKDYCDDFLKTLNSISASQDKEIVSKLQTLSQDERGVKIEELYNELTAMMRKEIGYYSK
jgi:hypothetical protein